MKRKYGQDKVWKQKNERRSVGSGLSLVFVVFNPWVGRCRDAALQSPWDCLRLPDAPMFSGCARLRWRER